MKKISYLLFLGLLFVGCTSNDQDGADSDVVTIHLTVSPDIEEMIDGSTSRSAVTPNGNVADLYFMNNDSVGIFPSNGYQIPFIVSGVDGMSTSVDIQARGWATDPSLTYVAYYPYNKNCFNPNAIPVNYQGMVQDGNNSASHLKDYLYQATDITSPVNNRFSFQLRHIGGTFKFVAAFDANDNTISYPLTLKRFAVIGRTTFKTVNSGYYDLFSTNADKFHDCKYSRGMFIDLKNVTINSASEEVTVWTSFAAPLAFVDTFDFVFWDEDGNVYTFTKAYNNTRNPRSAAKVTISGFTKNNAFKSTINQYIEEEAAQGNINS